MGCAILVRMRGHTLDFRTAILRRRAFLSSTMFLASCVPALAQDADDWREFARLKRALADVTMRFEQQKLRLKSPQLEAAADKVLDPFTQMLGIDPKGPSIKGYLTGLSKSMDTLQDIVGTLEGFPPNKTLPKSLTERLEMVGDDTKLKVDYASAHVDAPYGFVLVGVITMNNKGPVNQPTQIVYMSEGDYEDHGPSMADDFGTTNTGFDTRLTPGRYVFFKKGTNPKGSEPRKRDPMNRERVGSKGEKHLVQWLVKP